MIRPVIKVIGWIKQVIKGNTNEASVYIIV